MSDSFEWRGHGENSIREVLGYCGKNASGKFVDIIAEGLVVQRLCKYNIVTNFPVVIYSMGLGP